MQVLFCYFLLLLAFVNAQNVNEIKDDLEKKLKEIPGIDQLNSTLPDAEEVEKILREKCIKNGADPSLVEDIKNQQDDIQACVTGLVDSEVLQAELQEAKKTGSMDEVFGKYCKKYPEVYECILNVTKSARKCLDPEEVGPFDKSLEILKELKEFICYKDGDRIAMFVAEGGYECMNDRKAALQACVNSTISARFPVGAQLSVAGLPTFLFSNRDCDDYDKIRQCVNVEMVKCKNSTPANIVDTFFKFLRKQMPCEGTTRVQQQAEVGASSDPSSSSTIYSSVVLLVSTVAFAARFH